MDTFVPTGHSFPRHTEGYLIPTRSVSDALHITTPELEKAIRGKSKISDYLFGIFAEYEKTHHKDTSKPWGIGLELRQGDVAARGNFCTLGDDGKITDRRAGRIASDESAPLARKLNAVRIPGYEVVVEPVKEHRFVVVFRGPNLAGNVKDTDPQKVGAAPLDPVATDSGSEQTAQVARQFIQQATRLLAGQPKANGLTLRGFAARPALPTYEEVYGLRAAAIAVYPMYKGLAQLVGMKVVGQAQTLDQQMDVLADEWKNHDFFFIHFKYTDSTGEDGNFAAKVKRIEELDAVLPRITALRHAASARAILRRRVPPFQ